MGSLALFLLLLLLFNLSSYHVSGQRVIEDGYTVTTVIDGHKLKINPHAVLPQPGSSDLLVLDSSNSSVYTLSLPISQESVVKRLSGNGIDGYSDGESGKAQFKNPRSFAVDLKGNVYVADRKNHAIRKISKSGVSTIAGGYSQTPGREDGPGRNATFSDDFEVVFVPEICALLISDHGTQSVRQIDLKSEDCVRGGGSHSVLGAASVWILGLGLSCLFGLIVGFVIHPYIITRTGTLQPRLFPRDMEALPNQSGETSTETLLRHQKHICRSIERFDEFYGNLELSDTTSGTFKRRDGDQRRSDVFSDCPRRIDNMIQANMMGFATSAKETTPLDGPLVVSSGLVKRR